MKKDHFYKFNLVSIEGKNIQMNEFSGKVILFVNVARKSKYSD